MMKHIKNTILAGAALLLSTSLYSCSDVSADDRFIELPPIEAKRVVLMEEFTGQLCVNCPAAHDVIAELLGQYPENLISVSIHGGGDAFSYSEEKLPGYGLRNDDGQAYCDAYAIPVLPAAVVNRSSGVLDTDQWASVIRETIAKPSHIDLDLQASLTSDGKKIEVIVDVMPYENYMGHLQLWLVESGIVSLQLTPAGFKTDYVHNHVFRAAINGHDGESMHLVVKEEQTLARTIDMRDLWNPDNLSVVAFFYTDSGVEQAVQAKVTRQ